MFKSITLINRLKVESFLTKNNMGGRFFGVTFYKKDGKLRTLNGRLGIKSKGNGRKTIGKPYDPYVVVYSNNDGGFRAVNLKTIIRITANGNLYLVR